MFSNTISISNPFTVYYGINSTGLFRPEDTNDTIKSVRLIKEYEGNANKYSTFEYTACRTDNDDELTHSLTLESVLTKIFRILFNKVEKNYLTSQPIESSVSMDNFLEGSKGQLYCLDTIVWDNKKYILSSYISFYVLKESKYYTISYEPLGIEVFEESVEDALECFYEEFSLLWKLYAQEDDNKLSRDALQLKHTLQNVIREVL